ncbi:NAD(P)-dependent oxidoreductase [Paenibacillus sp.]|uniref:NAD(P)-dependent oxidoreductase n=1 Tax=Paenibacillus sp. TaxID=58172 RepID=UPI002D4ABA66|nr:NAD(P)-dependent oxidoreductase [Paenibacillus sp.]HZG87865.1 NAD(P)-dependent oxidoreductase [Paenibacillus sp.]
MTNIGFIGLGAMGLPMARRLAEAGHALFVTVHRNPEPAEELRKLGAVVVENAAEAAAACDVMITILPADPEMEAVLLDERVIEALQPGKIVLEMTSGSPECFRNIAQVYEARGIRLLDAPVSGGVAGAANGTLTIMAGGDAGIIEETQDVLSVLSNKVIHVGEGGAGKAIKAINQMLAAVHMIAASEAIALGEKLGVDLEKMHQVIAESSGGSYVFDKKYKMALEERFAPGFKMNLMIKDMRIALSEGEGIPMPIATAAYQMYHLASRTDGDSDYAAVSKIIRGTSGRT